MSPDPKLFLDFDGTLTDPRARLYELFQELAPESRLSFDDYWRLKRGRITQADLLRQHFAYDDTRIAAFKSAWLRKIEEPARLAADPPLPGAADFLRRAAKKQPLYLVTARQHPEGVKQQIELLGWQDYFTALLVTGQTVSKDQLIRRHTEPMAGDTLIGDTGEDIQAGKTLGMRTVAVCSGILARDILATYNPDLIVDSVADLEREA